MDRGFDLLPSAVLLTIVATFDTLAADVVRTILELKPDRYSSSDKTISVADILSMKSFDDVKSKLLNDEIYQYSRGSHEEQVKYIEKQFHIKIIENWKRWPDFIEIFERRNLLAHGEKRFTQRYAEICKSQGHKGSEKLVGKEIELTTNYLSQSVDTLLEFFMLLIFSVWRKQIPEEEQSAFDLINHVIYRLITDERYRVPINVTEYVLGLKGVSVTEATRLMLIVNLASAYRHQDNKELVIQTLKRADWSAASDNYKICVAALREDVDEVVTLMAPCVSSNKISKDDFREWPVFSFVRDSDEYRSEFKKIFGENLFDPSADETEVSEVLVAEREVNEDGTIH